MSVTIRELKNHLSEYLRRIRSGEQLVVTDHGLPVAILGPVQLKRLSPAQRLALMAEAGELVLPRTPGGLRWTKPTAIRGRAISKSLLEDRG